VSLLGVAQLSNERNYTIHVRFEAIKKLDFAHLCGAPPIRTGSRLWRGLLASFSPTFTFVLKFTSY
jgi:hypothetical protein